MASGPDWPSRIACGLLAVGMLFLAQPGRADPPGPARWATTEARSPAIRPRPRPAWLGKKGLRCTADGAHCISLARYIPDTCRTLEATAGEAGLDAGFFARLIWRESLYDATAISPAGAQGIAQFMPGTAQRRGLVDPFNPAEALRASATYLAELRDLYGNVGFAAAAYNAGETRLEDFLQRDRRLPPETRAYVPAITGYSATEWRDAPPEAPEFALEKGMSFRAACEELARNRSLKAFRNPSSRMPWAVILAAHRSRDITAYRLQRAQARSAALQGQEISYIRMRLPARHGTQWTAQIGAESRKAADRICWTLRKSGVGCVVLKN